MISQQFIGSTADPLGVTDSCGRARHLGARSVVLGLVPAPIDDEENLTLVHQLSGIGESDFVTRPETRGRRSTELTASRRAVTVRSSVTSRCSLVATVDGLGAGGAAPVAKEWFELQADNHRSERTSHRTKKAGRTEAEAAGVSCIVRILTNKWREVNGGDQFDRK